MRSSSSLLLLGATALKGASALPSRNVVGDKHIQKRDVASWLTTEVPYAQERLLCNIGASGCAASGASSGIVIASPSKSSPDCACLCGLPVRADP